MIRPDVGVAGVVLPQEAGQPYSTEHGLLEGDLIFCASHTHRLYRNDNAIVYHNMEEATRGTPYSELIKTFQRQNNGRGALKVTERQYVGQDKCDAEINKMNALRHT